MSVHGYIDLLLANRRKILALWLMLLLALSAVIVNHLLTAKAVIDNSVGVWFDLTDPEIQRYDRYNTTFGEKEWTILVLKTPSIYRSDFLAELARATTRIEALDHVLKVTSITNVRDNRISAEDELDYSRLYTAASPDAADPISSTQFRDALAANPIFDKSLLNLEDERFAIVLIQNHNYIRDPSPYRIQLVESIGQIAAEMGTVEDWGLSGTTVVNAELNKAAQKDVIVFYLLVSTLLMAICWSILRNIRDLTIVIGMVVTSVLSAMAFLAALELPYNMATVMLPPILISLSVAGVLHIITDFHIAHRRGASHEALIETYGYLTVPTVWAALTTIAGLASFAFSGVAPIFQLGVYAAFGMAISLIANMTVVPVLLHLFWRDRAPSSTKESSFNIHSGRKLLAHPGIMTGAMMLVLVMLYGLSRAEVDTDYSEFFSDDTRISHSYDLLKEAGIGENPITLHLKVPTGRQYIEPDYFAGLLAFERELGSLPQVKKLLSVTNLVAEVDKAYNGEGGGKERLLGYTKNQLAQLWLLAELSGNDDIDDFSLKSRGEQQIVVLTPYLSSRELRNFRERVAAIQTAYLPEEVEVIVTGTTVLWANMDTQITRTQAMSLAFVGTLLIIGLPLLFRSPWLGLFGAAINFLPLAATLGLMSWLGIKINMATVILGAISIGVVVDDTIHMFYRMRRFRNLGYGWKSAVESTLETIGTSIYRTTIILIAAFTCMATSDFLPTAHFGIFVSISVAIALFLDLIVAPYLLVLFGEARVGEEAVALEEGGPP